MITDRCVPCSLDPYSPFFSSIATDDKGVIQIFNIGAERMLGYAASADVVDQITPIAPGFDALVFKASRGIQDIYELTSW
jgi:nitrogen fixation/metabolism regulation signal transduction histidine kinase